MRKDRDFHDYELIYECIPDPDNYNSNSFAAGLLEAAGLPKPVFPSLWFLPGITRPVPVVYFQP